MAVSPHVFALGADSIRYGHFPRASTGLEFREYHDVDLSPGTFGAGLIGRAVQEERSLREGVDDLMGRLSTPVTEASLVLPDSWLRIAFAEITDLPRSAGERDDVLRWKLDQLVPFRVDDLRLQVMEVEPLLTQQEPRRMLLGFGLESLLGQLEATFSSYGVRIGSVSNVSLSLLQAVWEAAGSEGQTAVVSVDEDGYTLAFAHAGKPILHRFKALESAADGHETSVLRELKLTESFVRERFSSAAPSPIYLFAPTADEDRWKAWLQQGLAGFEVRSASEFVSWGARSASAEAWRIAPLMGAACTMVS